MNALIIVEQPSKVATYLLNKIALYLPSTELRCGTIAPDEINNYNFVFYVGTSPEYSKFGLKCALNDEAYKTLEPINKGYISQFDLASKCFFPDTFAYYSPIIGLYPAVWGEIAGTLVFVLPDNLAACSVYFDTQIGELILDKTCQKHYATLKLLCLNTADLLSYCNTMSGKELRLCVREEYGDVSINVMCSSNATSVAEAAVSALTRKFSEKIYCCDDTSLQRAIYGILSMKNKTLAVAESVTGGLIAAKLVEISGVSKAFAEGIVSYSNAAKQLRLNVKSTTLDSHTAVSPQVAQEMAQGLLPALNTDYVLSITGYAERPNTLDFSQDMCYICIADKHNAQCYSLSLDGERNDTRHTLANCALFYLLNYIKTH